MTYTVELRYIGGDIADLMLDMRIWFDRNGVEPRELLHSSGPLGLAFRVEFSDRDQAIAFAEAFRGWLECADTHGAGARWTIPPRRERGRLMASSKPRHSAHRQRRSASNNG